MMRLNIHCVKSVRIGVILVRIFRIRTKYGEIRSISPYSVQMRENTDESNSEYGHFSRSDYNCHERCFTNSNICHLTTTFQH